MATISPRSMERLDSLQGGDFHLAQAKNLGNVFQLDHLLNPVTAGHVKRRPPLEPRPPPLLPEEEPRNWRRNCR